jgi:hypothetical protein
MAAATERIPILVTKSDKTRFTNKAKSFGMSISEFARTAMDQFDPSVQGEEQALVALLEEVHRATAQAEKALDEALAFCAASNARLAKLDSWQRQQAARV